MTGFCYTTNSFSKSVISEDHPQFAGTLMPEANDNSFVIGLGAITTGIDTNNTNIRGSTNKVLASNNSCFVGSKFYGNVSLEDFMKELITKFKS